MEILIFVVLFVAFLVRFTAKSKDVPTLKVETRCPPHVWEWKDKIDGNGLKQGEYIACRHCGPLSKMLREQE